MALVKTRAAAEFDHQRIAAALGIGVTTAEANRAELGNGADRAGIAQKLTGYRRSPRSSLPHSTLADYGT